MAKRPPGRQRSLGSRARRGGKPAGRAARPPMPSVAQALIPPPPAPAAPATGPYQGPAGIEHSGRQRTPMPDWADPSSANYERRNYYIAPHGGIVAREPGYYNPENPWDTGRRSEVNEEFGKWDPSAERRMSEPGVTPWGPGGKPTAPGSFAAPGGPPASPTSHPRGLAFAQSLLSGPRESPVGIQEMGDLSGDPATSLAAALQGLIGKVPRAGIPARAPRPGRRRRSRAAA
jgi:hypothetical protein